MNFSMHRRILAKRLATLAFAAMLTAGLAGCSPRHAAWLDLPLPKLSNDFQPLRAQFNRDTGKVRVLMLLDPT